MSLAYPWYATLHTPRFQHIKFRYENNLFTQCPLAEKNQKKERTDTRRASRLAAVCGIENFVCKIIRFANALWAQKTKNKVQTKKTLRK